MNPSGKGVLGSVPRRLCQRRKKKEEEEKEEKCERSARIASSNTNYLDFAAANGKMSSILDSSNSLGCNWHSSAPHTCIGMRALTPYQEPPFLISIRLCLFMSARADALVASLQISMSFHNVAAEVWSSSRKIWTSQSFAAVGSDPACVAKLPLTWSHCKAACDQCQSAS